MSDTNFLWFGTEESYNQLQILEATAVKMMTTDPESVKVLQGDFLAAKDSVGFDDGIHGHLVYRAGREGRTGVIDIEGGLTKNARWYHSWLGMASYEAIESALFAAERDGTIDSVLLKLDTPGGSVAGLSKINAAIERMKKPVIAYTDGQMASAGYWIGSSAQMVGGDPLASIGSVGVIYTYFNVQRQLEEMGVDVKLYRSGTRKAKMNSFETPDKEDEAEMQAFLDKYYGMFLDHVGSRRPKLDKGNIADSTGNGQVFVTGDAVRRGLADFVSSLPDLLADMDKTYNNNQDY